MRRTVREECAECAVGCTTCEPVSLTDRETAGKRPDRSRRRSADEMLHESAATTPHRAGAPFARLFLMPAPLIRSEVVEELEDADIVEAKPLPRSGTYVAVPRGFAREEMPMLPPAFPEEAETGLSNVVPDLARLSDPSCRPHLRNDESAPLDESEAYVAALVRDGFSMQAIIDICPMSEESSVRILAKLVTDGVVTFG